MVILRGSISLGLDGGVGAFVLSQDPAGGEEAGGSLIMLTVIGLFVVTAIIALFVKLRR